MPAANANDQDRILPPLARVRIARVGTLPRSMDSKRKRAPVPSPVFFRFPLKAGQDSERTAKGQVLQDNQAQTKSVIGIGHPLESSNAATSMRTLFQARSRLQLVSKVVGIPQLGFGQTWSEMLACLVQGKDEFGSLLVRANVVHAEYIASPKRFQKSEVDPTSFLRIQFDGRTDSRSRVREGNSIVSRS